ncbi:hypothetical protein LR48_Vigan03g154900 [Vigna angularis]|uniref:Uncharacterized protein n=1 Tax=Phaseolus angularis TaxID=3914 RepID=A0A0L9U682_PHAAN|nr:hypothetical protein LR48_Vigan03g154900 [Vigna angularis]
MECSSHPPFLPHSLSLTSIFGQMKVDVVTAQVGKGVVELSERRIIEFSALTSVFEKQFEMHSNHWQFIQRRIWKCGCRIWKYGCRIWKCSFTLCCIWKCGFTLCRSLNYEDKRSKRQRTVEDEEKKERKREKKEPREDKKSRKHSKEKSDKKGQ